MSKTADISHDRGVTTIRFTTAPTYQDVVGIIDELVDKYPYEIRLWDLSCINFDFSMDELMAIADYGKGKFIKPNLAAFVAPDDLAYGELRAFEVFREQKSHSTARVFRTVEEALQWIEESKKS